MILEWASYQGDYEKQYYDIRLDDGSEITQCYPSSGKFHTIDGKQIDEFRVTHYRKSSPPKG
jgi:hypothetical protein